MRIVTIIVATAALTGCTEDMQQRIDKRFAPKVIDTTANSVTISNKGNSVINTTPTPEVQRLANATCAKLGKQKGQYMSSVIDEEKTEFNRNNHLFLCT